MDRVLKMGVELGLHAAMATFASMAGGREREGQGGSAREGIASRGSLA